MFMEGKYKAEGDIALRNDSKQNDGLFNVHSCEGIRHHA
jgi:hypothetical protein